MFESIVTAILANAGEWPTTVQVIVIIVILFFGKNLVSAGEKTTLKNVQQHEQPQWMTDIHDIRESCRRIENRVEATERMVNDIRNDIYARRGVHNYERLAPPVTEQFDSSGG